MLNGFFAPKAVAVIGASFDSTKIGHLIVKNIIDAGFKGKIYPINPKGGELLGLKVYPRVSELPNDCDLAVFAVPPSKVLSEMVEVGKKRIPCALIITSGFKEIGGDGVRLERELFEICIDYQIKVIGPNCFGIHNTTTKLNTTFLNKVPLPGKIAFISQSGAVCVAILDWSLQAGIGFSKFVSMGNKMDVDESQLIDFLADDPETEVIVGYLESVKSGREFIKIAKRSSPKKPIVLFKAGTTELGAKAASSHTGALAGSDVAFDAACKQTGIIRSPLMEQLFDFAVTLSSGKKLMGNRIAIITNSGGPAVIATDSIEKSSLKLAEIKENIKERLKSFLPSTASVANPVDLIGDATAERYRDAIWVVKDDTGIDGFVIIMTPTERLVPEEVSRHIVEFSRHDARPVISVFLGGHSIENAKLIATGSGCPVVSAPERAVNALDALNRRRIWLESDKEPFIPKIPGKSKAGRLIEYALSGGITQLTEQESRSILSAYGIRFPKSIMAQKATDAVIIAENLGYPVVMKVVSRDIIHKSDAGGVKIGLNSPGEIIAGFEAIMKSVREKRPDAKIEGVVVQPMMKGGKEIIIGGSREPQFGPLVMFGLGGIYVEAMKDVSFRLAGMSHQDALSMVEEIKSIAVLKGARGEKPSDIDSIVDMILRISCLMVDFPQIKELDINPVLVFEEGSGSVALDARITLEGQHL